MIPDVISSINFTGMIPGVIGNLQSLKSLNFSHNMLRGTIPLTLGKWTNLEWFDLSSNELVGVIPPQLTDLIWISFLSLSQNQLVGPIPRGKQFNIFGNDSFNENLDLCGFHCQKCAMRKLKTKTCHGQPWSKKSIQIMQMDSTGKLCY